MSICNEKKYANDVLRHGFISEVLPRLLGISGYVQIPTVKIKRNLPQLWYICIMLFPQISQYFDFRTRRY